jgi:hypothetical protein
MTTTMMMTMTIPIKPKKRKRKKGQEGSLSNLNVNEPVDGFKNLKTIDFFPQKGNY